MIDRLAERNGIRVTRNDSKALVGVGTISGQEVMLAKPQTFMNLSGASVKALMEKHSVEPGERAGALRRAGFALDRTADPAERFGRRT